MAASWHGNTTIPSTGLLDLPVDGLRIVVLRPGFWLQELQEDVPLFRLSTEFLVLPVDCLRTVGLSPRLQELQDDVRTLLSSAGLLDLPSL